MNLPHHLDFVGVLITLPLKVRDPIRQTHCRHPKKTTSWLRWCSTQFSSGLDHHFGEIPHIYIYIYLSKFYRTSPFCGLLLPKTSFHVCCWKISNTLPINPDGFAPSVRPIGQIILGHWSFSWLVVEPYPPEKYDFVSWEFDIPKIFQTTNQLAIDHLARARGCSHHPRPATERCNYLGDPHLDHDDFVATAGRQPAHWQFSMSNRKPWRVFWRSRKFID